jgi:hypothetical protein
MKLLVEAACGALWACSCPDSTGRYVYQRTDSATPMATITAISKEGNNMNAGLMLVSVALGAALLAGCDRGKQADSQQKNAVPIVMSQPTPQVPSSAPASAKDGKAPIQGEVDPKEPAQRRAFETK